MRLEGSAIIVNHSGSVGDTQTEDPAFFQRSEHSLNSLLKFGVFSGVC